MKFKISPKIIFFLLVEVFLFLLLGFRTGLDIFYFFFIFLAVVLVFDLLFFSISFFAGKSIKITRKAPEKIIEDDTLSVELTVVNQGFSPLTNILLEDFAGCAADERQRKFFIDVFKPQQELTLTYECLCDLRGCYFLGPVKTIFSDFLGFFSFEIIWDVKKKIYVYPRIFKIKQLPILVKGKLPWFGVETISESGDDQEFFGIREYMPGDPMKRIHWLSTARKQTLIVKEFERISFYQVFLMFVLNEKDNIGYRKENVCEYIIKIAASLVKYFIDKDVCLEIMAHTGELTYFPLNKGSDFLEEIFKFFAAAKAESQMSIAEMVQENSKFIAPNSTVLVLLTEKSLPSLSELAALNVHNVSIVAFVMLSSTFTRHPPQEDEIKGAKQGWFSQLSKLNIKTLFFSKGDDLAEVFSRASKWM